MYADDTTLMISHNNLNYLKQITEIAEKQAVSWFLANKLSSNHKKTQHITLSLKQEVNGPSNPEIIKKKRKGDPIIEEIPIVRINECSDLVKEHIRSRNVTKPKGLLDFEITAFSYFFERATEVGLIDPYSSGYVSLKELKKAAADSCMNPNVEMPFICIDLLFITILLEDGYGLLPDSTVTLVNRLDGHEVSWSLGAAFHYLQNGL